MKSYMSLLLIALFFGAMLTALPVPTIASTGTAGIGYAWGGTLPTTPAYITGVATNAAVRAGDHTLVKADGLAPLATPNWLAINLSSVTFSGSQFSFFLSRDGLSQRSPDDINFTGYFSVSTLNTIGPLSEIRFSNPLFQNGTGVFYYGSFNASNRVVLGPVPFYIPGGDFYLKVYDGSATFLAVSIATITVLPNIFVSPTTPVPAGTTMNVQGVAWPTNGLVNVTVWDPGSTIIRATTLITPASDGTFAWTFPMPDEGKFANIKTPAATYTDTVEAFNTTTGILPPSDPLFDVSQSIFYIGRQFDGFLSKDNAGGIVAGPLSGTFGSWPDASGATFNGKVLGTIYVNGSNFNPSGSLTINWDYDTASPVTITPSFIKALTSAGAFQLYFTVPITTLGTHHVAVVDASWSWNFTVNILTTLVLNPTSGPEGTIVQVLGYGFEANKPLTLYWLGTELTFPVVAYDDYIQFATGFNTSSTGFFSTSFTVPGPVYGGDHLVYANTSTTAFTTATFFVEPSFTSDPTTQALGNKFRVYGHGLGVGTSTYQELGGSGHFDTSIDGTSTGTSSQSIAGAYDNAMTYNGNFFGVTGDSFGELEFTFVAAGVPMVHIVQIFDITGLTVSPTQLALFQLTVTGSTIEGAQILTNLASLASDTAAIQSALASLTTTVGSVQSALNSLATSVASSFSTVNTKLDNLATSVAGVNTAVSGLQSYIGGQFTTTNNAISALQTSIGSQFSSLNTAVSGVQSALGGKIDSVSSAVSGLQSSVSSLSGSVNTLSGTVNSVKTAVDAINANTGAIGTISTVLYIAVVLVAIAVVLEIVVLVRKK